MVKRIAIVGSGHLGQQILHHITNDSKDEVIGFFDEFQQKKQLVNGIPIIGGNDDILFEFKAGKFDSLIIAIGYKHINFKKELFNQLVGDIPFYTFVHSSCFIDPTAKVEDGTVIFPGCVIDQHVDIGPNVLINVGCTIAHDTKIGSHSFLSPKVAIAGFVAIGESNVIGINATIIDNIITTGDVQIGGGAVVIKNIEQAGLYVGNPVRFIR